MELFSEKQKAWEKFMKKTIIEAKKLLDELDIPVKKYGQDALVRYKLKLGKLDEKASNQDKIDYYNRMLLLIKADKKRFINNFVAKRHLKDIDDDNSLGTDEKWLFFHRYEAYLGEVLKQI